MMRRRWPLVARVFALTALMAVLPTTRIASAPIRPAVGAAIIRGQDAQSRLLPEVRLRKLHLVRPDLIQYPIYYEVYC